MINLYCISEHNNHIVKNRNNTDFSQDCKPNTKVSKAQ